MALRNRLQEFFNGVGRYFDQDSIAIRCVEQSCPSVIEVECPLRAFLLYEVFAIFRALLTLPWVFVLWFAAFCGVVLITAGLIGSSR